MRHEEGDEEVAGKQITTIIMIILIINIFTQILIVIIIIRSQSKTAFSWPLDLGRRIFPMWPKLILSGRTQKTVIPSYLYHLDENNSSHTDYVLVSVWVKVFSL